MTKKSELAESGVSGVIDEYDEELDQDEAD